METPDRTFSREAAAMRESAAVSTTDAICRIPKLQRAFKAETEVIRQRIQILEAVGEVPHRRLTRRMIRWFWCAVILASLGAFAAGYLVSLRH